MKQTGRLIPLLFLLAFWSCEPTVVREPDIDLGEFKVEEGFQVELIASEPLLDAPVAMDFDDKGRMWVVEMKGYMPNIDGTGEEEPNGRIVILEDKDQNGRMDHAQVFLDNLVLPRALLHVYGGLLYCEPPNLWFVEIEKDKAGKKVLVDSMYAFGGNVEHLANGLLYNMDNWIYSAKSNLRYKRVDGQWIKDFTSFRGQWGITKDEYGRIYTNDNSNQLAGDYLLPNMALANSYFKPRRINNQQIVTDQRVYPLQATAVNRGYMDGVLAADGKLKNVTSACGPLIYLGGSWPTEYSGNAFVCAPEVNLIKRNLLTTQEGMVVGQQAYQNREFLATMDEGFRPVNMNIGPDGNVYIIDMHRGLIQHKSYMTDYLRKSYLEKGLDTVVNMGRILKVSHREGKEFAPLDLSKSSSEDLINLLDHENGWMRDRAQRILTGKKDEQLISLLKKRILSKKSHRFSLHAMWVLESWNALDEETLDYLMSQRSEIGGSAFYLSMNLFPDFSRERLLDFLTEVSDLDDPIKDAFVISSLCQSRTLTFEDKKKWISGTLAKYKDADFFQELTIVGMKGEEEAWLDAIADSGENPGLKKNLETVIQNRKEGKKNRDLASPFSYVDNRTEAMLGYRMYCATCHGQDGEGLDNLAPPLNGSEFVSGSPDRLILITLHGLKGPVTVDGEEYNMKAVMPGNDINPLLTDEKIADILNFIRNGFATAPQNVKASRVKELRTVKPSDDLWTVESLDRKIHEIVSGK